MFVRWNAPQESSSLKNALFGLYSDGVYAAEYIEGNLDKDELIITTDVAYASTIFGFAEDYRAYYAGSLEKTSYADWSEKQTQRTTSAELIQGIKKKFAEKNSFILIYTPNSCVDGLGEILQESILLYQTQGSSARGEDYAIYRVNIK